MNKNSDRDIIQNEKIIIRKSFRLLRKRLNENYVREKSEKIFKIIKLVIDIKKFEHICFYIDFDFEVSTKEIVEYALENSLKVSVPFITHDKNIKLKYIKDIKKDIDTNFREPKPFDYCEDADINSVNLFIIPGICFDEKCARLGFGGGYYDRILSKNKNALRIALAYDYQIMPNIPSLDSDEIMDIIISDRRIVIAS